MAEMSGGAINDLPDSAFGYIEPGGSKDSEGKTTPRSLRHFPIHDAAHVRNAFARLDQSPFGDKARAKVEAAAKRMGIGEPAGKAMFEMKAELLGNKQLERWMHGEMPRRLLVVPFGGPLPGGKAGVDLDGEFFDADSDLYGDFAQLRQSRERIVDWHHDGYGVPANAQWMKGTIMGRVVLDEDPSEFEHDGSIYEGVAADWWAKAGEQRMALIRALQQRGTPIFGSSQAYTPGVRKAGDGHIEVWPLIRHTISTSPQNTHAVVPPLKALLTSELPFDEVGFAALKAAMFGLDLALGADLRTPSADGGAETRHLAGRGLSPEQGAALAEALGGVATALRGFDPTTVI